MTPTCQRSRTRGAIYALRKERAISVPIQKAPDLLAKVGNTLSPPANPPPYDRSPATPEKAIPQKAIPQKAVPPEDAPKPNVSDVDKIPLPMPGQWTLRHFLIVAGLVGMLGVFKSEWSRAIVSTFSTSSYLPVLPHNIERHQIKKLS